MSELRQDLVSGNWVIIAPGRAARPRFLDERRPVRKSGLKSICPFEDLQKSGNWPPLATYPNEKKWEAVVLPNKYPAVIEHQGQCSVPFREGPYLGRTGVGRHNLIVTRDHNKNFMEITPRLATAVLGLFQKLCRDVVSDPCGVYGIPFFNWGSAAGASVWHPHYQFISLPIVPAHSDHSLKSAARYHDQHGRCARCTVLAFERKEKKRIIAENAYAIAIAPYASKFAFEVSIVPKRHEAYFYRTSAAVLSDMAILLQSVMRRIKKTLQDPDLNMFIHEAILDNKQHAYHHWHIEIIPRITTAAGFELSTGFYINSVEPERAAEFLRKAGR